ncbi:site-2 protease family protein [Aquipuribacter sp. SD81]|uniref:site-2 protease family protein n=1 Tax=Aquipuribacter sp. SD81 TaxID=3127703 RepID=UPI00301AEE99
MSDAPARTSRRRRLRIATVAGVPVLLSPSWLVVAALVTFFFGPLASRSTGLGSTGGFGVAAVLAVLLAVSVLLHEAAHAVAARARGLHVAEVVVDLWGGHTSLGRPRTPGESALVSVVGPLVNVVLGGLALAAGALVDGPTAGSPEAVVGFLLAASAVVNLVLGVLNLVPGLPLDGGRVLEALVWRLTGQQDTGTVVAAWVGRLAAVGLVVWLLGRPLLAGRLPGTVDVVWVLLVGLFLWQGASGSLRVARFRRRAARVDLAAVSRPAVAVPARASVARLESLLAASPATAVVLVDDEGRPVALLDGGSVADVPTDQRDTTPASALGVRLPPTAVVPARLGPVAAVEALARSGGAGVVLVDDTGRPTARVLPDDFADAMGLA